MIFLSAGHYPERAGACFDSFCEHFEAVRWVNEIAGIIDTECVIVPSGVLKKKARYINSYDTGGIKSLCIDIHFNSAMKSGKHVGSGSECLYMPDSQRGAYLANELQKAIVADGVIRDRGIKEGWYRMNRLNGPDYFLSKTKWPAVIIEPEFIQHVDRITDNRNIVCSRLAESLLLIHKEWKES